MNIADFFIGMAAGLLLPVVAFSIIYLAVKRILTKDPKIAIRFAMKHMKGKPDDKSESASSVYPTWPIGFPSTEGENGIADSAKLQPPNSTTGHFGSRF